MPRYPLNVLVKSSNEKRIEIGGTAEVAEAFLPSQTTADIRIGDFRKRSAPLRPHRPLPAKRRSSGT